MRTGILPCRGYVVNLNPRTLLIVQIVPYINGVNSVRIISILADADFSLTCRAIRHLLYYGCLFLLDIFTFSAIYAPTAQFTSTIACDEAMQQECARYVNTLFAPLPTDLSPATTPPRGDPREIWPPVGGDGPDEDHGVVDGVGIVELYASLKQGQSVKQWYIQHARELANIDIRRFITFGIIKGFLYRVHKYAYETGMPAPPIKSVTITAPQGMLASGPSSRGPGTGTNSPYATSAGDDTAPIAQAASSAQSGGSRTGTLAEDSDEDDDDVVDDKTLSRYLDGMHCFDQICTELQISERELTARLKRYPREVLIIHR